MIRGEDKELVWWWNNETTESSKLTRYVLIVPEQCRRKINNAIVVAYGRKTGECLSRSLAMQLMVSVRPLNAIALAWRRHCCGIGSCVIR